MSNPDYSELGGLFEVIFFRIQKSVSVSLAKKVFNQHWIFYENDYFILLLAFIISGKSCAH